MNTHLVTYTSSSDRSSKPAAAPCCESKAASRCVLVFASGTWMESACCEDQALARLCLSLQGSRHQAPTNQASLRLLRAASQRRPRGACSSLLLALGWRDSACHQDNVCLCNGAAIKRRLIEQACGCSVLRVKGGLKVRARRCLWHLDGDTVLATRIMFTFAREPPSSAD